MRVLILFGGEELFGAERANIEVFCSLRELGLQARFITSKRLGAARIQPELTRLNLEWTTAPFGTQWARWLLGREWYLWFSNIFGVVATSWRLWRESRRWNATHLYVTNGTHYSYAGFALKWSPLPVVYRAGDELSAHNFIYRWIRKAILRRVDVMVCNSEYVKKSYLAGGMSPGKLRVIYNRPPRRAEPGKIALPPVPTQAIVVTFIGQLAEHKGIYVLLEAAETMLRAGRNMVFWIVGAPSFDEGESAAMRKQVADAGLQARIIFWGYQENIYEILAGTDIHVCPSLFAEPSANVVGEAKMAGVPSVVFPSGGLPELIEHGVDGFICRDQTPGALQEGIEFLAADPGRRQVAGAAARRSLDERFGREQYQRKWAEVFLQTKDRTK